MCFKYRKKIFVASKRCLIGEHGIVLNPIGRSSFVSSHRSVRYAVAKRGKNVFPVRFLQFPTYSSYSLGKSVNRPRPQFARVHLSRSTFSKRLHPDSRVARAAKQFFTPLNSLVSRQSHADDKRTFNGFLHF